ncbi:biotin--[acetyl-CoA-carboxylase] ligase [Halanaerobium salsuginis]|uniref:BirA family transcriptional regulator, biotin operon repressor / biotin-[acetyl-CoA-carboxylase] ligase n=1 Tax=Halanaerobium salsuginis TaxID=29563 RepID=A0A1I4KRK2_9FIRM|nr:biotin--[acetyl-CoA-carboxylase] ligase [Halanaerobium salsuginis]SFL81442.1 BirA family transcriptional regulator, biotin operon repressor / biotin-[acetyl-CoA-carboxylase] ligase [Halanaerobium salsuginis]
MNKENQFNVAEIKNYLKKQDYDLKQFKLNIFSEVDSTNDCAKEFIESKLNSFSEAELQQSPFVFAAEKQLKGRGRRGHTWFSNNSAGLAVSFLYKVEIDLARLPQITAAAGLAVQELLKEISLPAQIKWPNDLIVNQRKISGILTELVFNDQQEAYVIIGCGVNLNNKNFNAEVSRTATSFYQEKNKAISKSIFLARLLIKMNLYIKKYFSHQRESLIKVWKKELNLTDKKVRINYKNDNYLVIIKKVLDNGDLWVRFKHGQEKILKTANTSLDYSSLVEFN